MDRNIKLVRELEQVFEPYRIMFKELTGKDKETKKTGFITMFLQSKQNTQTHIQNTKVVFFGGEEGGRSVVCVFSLFAACLGI
jgi:hypothetical protein